ncbi:MAG TPA: hypothetical protein VLN57_11590 [Xanthobacteraceae bacterium]|jgi:hypothetical protein|nr:hypothetical protein [Xanthobacteraceae bacterium]
MAQGIDPEKLIHLLFRWGWRGPVALALVIFGVWLISAWIKQPHAFGQRETPALASSA